MMVPDRQVLTLLTLQEVLSSFLPSSESSRTVDSYWYVLTVVVALQSTFYLRNFE